MRDRPGNTSPSALSAYLIGVLVGVTSLAGCQTAPRVPELVVVNRTVATLAVPPRFVLLPCSQVAITSDEYERALQSFVAAPNPYDWVPLGAVVYELGSVAAPEGAPQPTTVVITAERRIVLYGAVSEGDLPACSGRPSPS